MFPVVVLLLFFVLLLLTRRRWRGQSTSADVPDVVEDVEIRERNAAPPGRGAAGTRRMRRRTGAAAVPSAASTSYDEDDAGEGEEEDGDEETNAGYYVARSSKKKEAKKHDKVARRQAEAVAREAKQERTDHYAEMRRKRDENREAEELRKEEAARAQKLKDEVAANEEFEKWKGAFSIETEGTLAEEEGKVEGLLNDFVEYIREHKCVDLEDLAAEFRMKSQDCINRIQELEQMGRLSGVMDDRGKFIYISPEEMKAVADYIKQTGRVSIAHLAQKSNEFIDLQPTAAVESGPSVSLSENTFGLVMDA